MAEFVAKRVAKNMLKEHRPEKRNTNDFYYVTYPVTDRHGRETGKMAKRKRVPPPGLKEHDQKVMETVLRRAKFLDNAMSVGGVRVGWGAVVGFIPFLGDFFDTIAALWVFEEAKKVGLDRDIQVRMLINILIDFGIGLVPFIGDIADVLWRANTMNAVLLYNFLEKRGAKNLREEDAANEKRSRSRPGRSGHSHGQGVLSQPAQAEERIGTSATGNHDPAEIARPAPARVKSGGLLDRINPFAARPKERDPEKAEGGYHDNRGRGHNRSGNSGHH